MPPSPPRLSVVVPTRDEAENLGPLWQRLEAALKGVEAEVCFVDDSDDDTPAALERLEAANPGVARILVRQDEQRQGGLSTAVVAGMHMARGEFVCVMDGDLQHPPERIPAMLAAAEAGADLVVASRYMPGGSVRGLRGWSRRLVSRSAGLVARALFTEARRSTDPLSGYFLCRRRLLDGIEFRPVGFKILLELLVCVPGLRVQDVALDFQPRSAGASKAGIRQGLLYLRHLWSLFFDVEGSARLWKFGLVGLSGLLLFLPTLALLSGPLHLHPLVAFLPAFCLSFAWNSALNRRWTLADIRRRTGPSSLGGYLERVLAAGVFMYAIYILLIAFRASSLFAGLVAAVGAMAVNGLTNRRVIRLAPSLWGGVAVDEGVRAGLARLAEVVGAERAYVLPPRASGESATPPRELVNRVVRDRRASLWTEAVSHRPQRRTNIELSSFLLLPVVTGDAVAGVVVCERHAARGFDAADMETGMHAVSDLVGALAAAGLPVTDVSLAVPSVAAAVSPAAPGATGPRR